MLNFLWKLYVLRFSSLLQFTYIFLDNRDQYEWHWIAIWIASLSFETLCDVSFYATRRSCCDRTLLSSTPIGWWQNVRQYKTKRSQALSSYTVEPWNTLLELVPELHYSLHSRLIVAAFAVVDRLKISCSFFRRCKTFINASVVKQLKRVVIRMYNRRQLVCSIKKQLPPFELNEKIKSGEFLKRREAVFPSSVSVKFKNSKNRNRNKWTNRTIHV